MSKPLSKKQDEILEFIKSQLRSKGYPPSIREICTAVGLSSSSTVHGHLSTLERKGYIRRDATKPRAIEILDDVNYFSDQLSKEMVEVPVLGEVAAGVPITAQENIIDSFPIPLNYFNSNRDLFMLKVKGDSMINAGIFEGDYILVEQADAATNGEIIVAIINDGYESESTVKRFYAKNGSFELHAENDAYSPIITNELIIAGKVIGLFRKF